MSKPLTFGPFVLDARNARLERDGVPVELPPKAFSLLCLLAQRPGELVTKDEMLDAVWGRRFVSESVLKTCVNAIRGALQDDPRAPRFIGTVARRGYRFIGATTAAPAVTAAPVDASAAAPDAVPDGSLVGRDAAVSRLLASFAEAGAARRQVILLAGEAGIGKSALIERFVRRAADAGACVAVGQCVEQFGSAEPYLPVLDALGELCRPEDGGPWAHALVRVAPGWHAQLPGLAAPAPPAPGMTTATAAAPERLLREFGSWLDEATAAAPLVLVLEDLHWSDHATLGLLSYLARRRGGGRWMLVASFRPTDVVVEEHPLQGLRQELLMHKLADELVLEAFSEHEVHELLQRRFAADGLADGAALARALHAHTEGLPLFVASVIEELLADGSLVPDAHGRIGIAAQALGRLQVPRTIAGMIERRIARLPGELKSLLEAASVLGTEFAHVALAQLLGLEAGAGIEPLQARCDELARRGEWLRGAGMGVLPDGRLAFRYAFRHALFQRVFYERAEPSRRLQLHLRAAQALQQLHGEQSDRVAGAIAAHHEQVRAIAAASGASLASAAADALHWRMRAARAAAALDAPADALDHYARALAGDPPPQQRARCLAARAELLLQGGDGPRALAESEQAMAIAESQRDDALWREVALARARVCGKADRAEDSLDLLERLIAARPRLSSAELTDALLAKAFALGLVGRLEDSDAASRAALQACGDDALQRKADILSGMAMTHWHRGTLAAGLALSEEARALHERAGDERGLARTLNRIGVFSMVLGRSDEAEAAMQSARQRARALHDVETQRAALINLIKLRADRADAEGALALLDEGWNLAPGFEVPRAESAFLQGYFYCHYLRGDLGSALASAERVQAFAEQLDAVYWRANVAALVADLYLHLGDVDRAGAMLDASLATIDGVDSRLLLPRLAAKRAWVDTARGQPAQALERLAALEAECEVEQPEDLTLIARVRAEAQLAAGDAAGAIATLAPIESAPTAEVWALILALRLRAQCRLGRPAARDLEQAARERSDARLPALEGLLLGRELAAALARAGRHDEARVWRSRCRDELARLVASLAGLADWRQRFEAAVALPAD